MKRLSFREWKLLALTAFVCAGFLGYRAVAAPAVGKWRDLRSEADELAAALVQHRLSLRQRDLIEQRYARLESESRSVGTPQEEIARLLKALRKCCESLALTDQGTQVLPVEEGGFYRKFALRMDLEGSVVQLADFMHAVVSSEEPFRIDELTMRATGRSGRARASMLITAVSAIPPAEGD